MIDMYLIYVLYYTTGLGLEFYIIEEYSELIKMIYSYLSIVI